MNWKFLVLAVIGIGIGYFLGYVTLDSGLFEISTEPIIIDDDLEEELKLANDNFDYCKTVLTEEKEFSKELWDDYWNCLLPNWCEEDIQLCLEMFPDLSFEELQKDLVFKRTSCYYAENYDKYFERYE